MSGEQGTLLWQVLMTCLALAGGGGVRGDTVPSVRSHRVPDPMVDTGQANFYSNYWKIERPRPGEAFYGEDAEFQGNPPAYRDNGDGTVTDLVTGLMWSKGVDARKLTPEQAEKAARKMTLGGHRDWRVPNIKELYSLMDFRGYTGTPRLWGFVSSPPPDAVPFINTDYFGFRYGNWKIGERFTDAQWLSSTRYVGTNAGGQQTVFGVNFADGRIKGYGYRDGHRVLKTFYVRYVRGKPYGRNNFVDNGDGTITDRNTGLTWAKEDSGKAMSWEAALAYADKARVAGHSDWRLPNAKELEYLVDYKRSPDTTDSAAISPLFKSTSIVNEAGQKDFPFYWTSTTHLDGPRPASNAAYVAFGRAMGEMRGRVMDVHGAGAQRSDPKTGVPGLDNGLQGDARRIYNFVRLVRGGSVRHAPVTAAAEDTGKYPLVVRLAGEGARSDYPSTAAGFIRRADRDGEGKVSRAEYDGSSAGFEHHDTNHDGYLDRNEAAQFPGLVPTQAASR